MIPLTADALRCRTRAPLPLLCVLAVAWLGAAAPARAADPRAVTIGLVSPSWNTQLPPAVAQQAGFFKEEGLSVRTFTIAAGGTAMVAALSSGDAQLVISGAAAILRGIAQGAPVVVVSSVVDKPDYALVGARGMKSLDELRGKVIATTGAGTLSEFLVTEALKRNGLLRNRDYTLVALGGTAVRLGALQAGRVQAVPLSSGERVRAERDGYPVLLEVGKALPDIPFTLLAVEKQFAAANPDTVVGVLRALGRAVELIRQDKDRAVEIGKAHGLEGDPAIQRRALDYIGDDYDVRLKKENLGILLRYLELKEPAERFFDERFLAKALGPR